VTKAIEVNNLRAGYSGVAVVRDLSMHVEAGEMVALIGPNGSGKSTTLLTMSGILPTISGEIKMLGTAPSSRRPFKVARSGIGHVAEDRCVFSQLTVAENLSLGCVRGGPKPSLAFEYFPALESLRKRKAGLLSGGEQQMLVIARALLRSPQVLLVDEMSLGLAPIIVSDVLASLRRIASDRGMAVLLVEQHVDLALTSCDRAYVLTHGVMTAEGRSQDLMNNRELLESSYLGEFANVGTDDRPDGADEDGR
jgi:branched-chain amino acid transport system ATP-binding protein